MFIGRYTETGRGRILKGTTEYGLELYLLM